MHNGGHKGHKGHKLVTDVHFWHNTWAQRAQRAQIPSPMDKVKLLLQEAELSIYVDKFAECGYDSVRQIISMGADELKELAQHMQMPPGHLARLRGTIQRLRVPTPKPVLTTTEPVLETTVSTASSSAMKRKREPDALETSHNTIQDLRLASLRHSNKQGHSAMVDSKKSGSKKQVYRCVSVLSKKNKRRENDPRGECPYRLHWGLAKDGSWNLKTEKCHFEHMPFCTGRQRVTKLELVNDADFVRHVKLADYVQTGKTAAKEALGGSSGRMDGSVKTYTVKRAMNDIKHVWKHDYADDWHKIQSWGREYERKNPRGKFHLQVDDENR